MIRNQIMPLSRTKTTIGLERPIEVFIYSFWPPAVVCHRGPPSTARAQVDHRTEIVAKLLNYAPECREMEIQLDILTYDIGNGHCLLRFILSIRTILDCLRNRIPGYNLAARKAVLYDRLLRLHQHQLIIPVVRQRQIEATHSEDAFLSSMLELSTILANQLSYC